MTASPAIALRARRADEGVLAWLYGAIREAIVDGRLRPGIVLPSTRSLAATYVVARGTAQAAYNQLISEGYLDARPGSGTRIAGAMPDAALRVDGQARRATSTSTLAASASTNARSGKIADRGAERAPVRGAPATIAFGETATIPSGPWIERLYKLPPAFPLEGRTQRPRPFLPHHGDVGAFPIDVWRRLHVRHLSASHIYELNESDAAGQPLLRAAIADHLAVARGVSVSAEHIVVLSSVQQALDLTMRILVAPGDAVWMEDPGYTGARQVMTAAGARLVDIAVDADGMRVDDGVRLAPSARLAYVTPSRQAPLGVSLSPERRMALLRWAREHRAFIFEDDYDSDYRFVAKPIPALKSLPGGDAHVILAGTFSKLLFPALRLAYVALPAHLVDAYRRGVSLTSRQANGLSQSVLADFMVDGHFDRHVRRMRKTYAARAQAFEHAAKRHWQGIIDVPTVQAGLDVVGRLVGMDEDMAVQRLAKAGIDAAPLGRYTSTRRLDAALVMGFAAFDEDEIDAGAIALAEALGRAVREPASGRS